MDDAATVKVACHAMGTRFEILLHGESLSALRAAGEEALAEIARLDRQLSLFRPDSEVSAINRRAAAEPVKVEPGLFRLLETCERLWQETGGMFDITLGPLMRCWGFREERESPPSPAEIAATRQVCGMEKLVLDPDKRTVCFTRPGMAIDFGAIGKGWAADAAALLLREAGVTAALLHGGTSTVYALGHPPDSDAWTIALRPPPSQVLGGNEWPSEYLRQVSLRDESLSVSAVGGRMIETPEGEVGHVLDPLLGRPVRDIFLAAVAHPSATASDAYSTALLPGGERVLSFLEKAGLSLKALLLVRRPSGEQPALIERGAWD